MKKSFTLILASLLFISLIAQTSVKHIPSGKKGYGSELFLQKRISKHRNTSFPESQNALKSAQVIKQRLDSMVMKISDLTGSLSINSDKNEYMYNSYGNEILDISYSWDNIQSRWINSYKTEYTYNENELKIKSLGLNWDEEMNQWMNSYMDEYTYNDKKMLSTQLSSYWDEDLNQWSTTSKTEYLYDSNDHNNQQLYSYWDDENNQWQPVEKTDFSFSGNGKITTEVWYMWNSLEWMQSGKYEYSYDAQGRSNIEVEYDWDLISGGWIGQYKYEYLFDANGNMNQEIEYKWNVNASQWLNDNKTDYFFNNSYLFNDLVLPFDVAENYFGHMITNGNSYGWDVVNNRWDDTNVDVFILSYSAVNVSNTNEIQNNGLTIYPNPAKDLVTFELKEFSENAIIELFDAKGNKALAQQLPANKQISVNQLNSGMYFYKIYQDRKILSGKIMIR